jgi:hypothetical protein
MVFLYASLPGCVAKPITPGAWTSGRIGKQDLMYTLDRDEYRCPPIPSMTHCFVTVDHGPILSAYAPPSGQEHALSVSTNLRW